MSAPTDDEIPDQIRLCLGNGHAVLHAVECFIGAYEAAGQAAEEAAHGCYEVFEALMGQTGAFDLGDIFGLLRDRIATVLGGTGTGEDLDPEEAAATCPSSPAGTPPPAETPWAGHTGRISPEAVAPG